MDHAQKMAFIANMADKALMHTKSTPNVVTPKGEMSHDKMLSFINSMTQKGLQHFDSGGTTLGGPTAAGPASNTTSGGVLGAVGNFLGTTNNFQGTGANIQAGTNAAQLNNAYTGTQGALAQQQGVTNTLNGGLNQGANTESNLTNQLTAEANGQGPNPALASLNQQTGQNIAQQAALAAGQRGGGANVGLLARENAQQGAATQQQAVGQAATQEAEQQLAAQGNLQNLASNQVAQGTGATQALNQTQQGEQGILQNANTANNNANVSQQSNLNTTNASVAAGNQSTTGNILSGIGSGLSSVAGFIGLAKGGLVKMDKGGNVLDANARKHIAPHNFALPGGRYPIHDINHARNALARVSQNGTPEEKAKVKAAVAKKYPSIGKAQGGMVSPPPAMVALNKGGDVKDDKAMPWHRYASGGITGEQTSGANSYVGNWLNSNVETGGPSGMSAGPAISTAGANPFNFSAPTGSSAPASTYGAGDSQFTSADAAYTEGSGIDEAGAGEGESGLGDIVPTMNAYDGGMANMCGGGELMKFGGKVSPANSKEKATVKGDSLKNDKVPAMLSQGELVIDRDTMKDPGPMGQMARALQAHISKRNKSK
jgi:hypothetical protein